MNYDLITETYLQTCKKYKVIFIFSKIGHFLMNEK